MTEFRKELRDFYLKEVPQGLNQYRKDVGRVVFKDIPREIRTTGSVSYTHLTLPTKRIV